MSGGGPVPHQPMFAKRSSKSLGLHKHGRALMQYTHKKQDKHGLYKPACLFVPSNPAKSPIRLTASTLYDVHASPIPAPGATQIVVCPPRPTLVAQLTEHIMSGEPQRASGALRCLQARLTTCSRVPLIT